MRIHRVSTALFPLALILTLAACGGSNDEMPTSFNMAITITGDATQPTANAAPGLPTDPMEAPGEDTGTTVPGDACLALADSLRTDVTARLDELYELYKPYYGDGSSDDEPSSGYKSSVNTSALSQNGASTNVRTAGVDELDSSKLVGNRLYVLREPTYPDFHLALEVFDITTDGGIQPITSIPADGTGVGILADERYVLLVSLSSAPLAQGGTEMTSFTKLTLLDMLHPTMPQTIFERDIEGYLVSGTAHDGTFRYLVDAWQHPLPNRLYAYYLQEGNLEAAYNRLQQETQALTLPELLPAIRSTNDDGQLIGKPITESDCINHADIRHTRYANRLVMGTLKLDESATFSSTYISATVSTAYVTPEHTYLLQSDPWLSGPDATSEDREKNSIHMFDNSGPENAELLASGSVQGMLSPAMPHFSIDEHDGYLRIATTTGIFDWFGGAPPDVVTSRITILQKTDQHLVQVGLLDGLAPGEQSYAARFIGERAFISTFEQIDPFMTIDLSDPHNPMLAGEIKVPGLSTYLHAIDDNHVLSVGVNGLDMSEIGISLFDISDFSNPVQTDSISFGDVAGNTYVWTDAIFDHHAFQISTDRSVATLPLNYYPHDNVLAVLTFSEAGQIEHIGNIDHHFDQHGANGTYLVKPVITRSFIYGEHIISISNRMVTMHRIANPEERVSEYRF